MNKRLLDLDEDVNRIDRDLSNDRKDIEELKINMVNVSTQLKSVMEILTRFQVKTADAVKDAVESANAPIQVQMNKFVRKKVIHIRPAHGFTEKLKEWFTRFTI